MRSPIVLKLFAYSDTAKSVLVLRRRTGLQQLFQDAVNGTSGYRAILVYDVSRWGRFQDTDESAHYEFLCKSAGVPVHYCAETFANDGTFAEAMRGPSNTALIGGRNASSWATCEFFGLAVFHR